MKHYGDISTLNGADLPPVDIITFGSPCTDMSVAGKRAGLDGRQSVLFYEAIRIIKEMRCKTNGRYPRYALWENVPYAFKRIRDIMNRKQLCASPPQKTAKQAIISLFRCA
jgi:Site-specific DNA methylase